MDGNSLGDRMKQYERWTATQAQFPNQLPIAIRVDGKRFSRWTAKLEKPYCPNLMTLFQQTAFVVMRDMLDEAVLAYGQSDEVTFLLRPTAIGATGQFGNKRQKLETLTASAFTAAFNNQCAPGIQPALFDARAILLPNPMEAHNLVLWRQQDATRNSIQGAARAHFSHSKCMNLNCNQLQDLLMTAGINWNDYPTAYKRGWTICRRAIQVSPQHLTDIAEEYRPTTPITRRRLIIDLDMPILKDPTYITSLLT